MDMKERKALVQSYMGKSVRIEIDRPIGYEHVKEKYSITYPINYGYIPGVLGGDGEELDVYLLGVNEPVKEYTAKIIGIVYRENDVEDKLVAAPEGMAFNQAEIAENIHFQEQYYKTHIDSLFEKSCGAVVYRNINGKTEYLCLLQQKSQVYSLPKGHSEAFETEQQTALREVYEETGIHAELKSNFRTQIQYELTNNKQKSVVIFLAEHKGEIKADSSEIKEYQWAEYKKAKQILPKWYETVIDDAQKYISNSKP
ncbi:MAG: NUDIX domain-containing protein [Clostridia bacterium]|nr:NUDIX domain-containing protein [Clostridia bacterium]